MYILYNRRGNKRINVDIYTEQYVLLLTKSQSTCVYVTAHWPASFYPLCSLYMQFDYHIQGFHKQTNT